MLKKSKEKNLKSNPQNVKSQKNFFKIKENSPRNYIKIINLFRVKRSNSDIGYQNLTIKQE